MFATKAGSLRKALWHKNRNKSTDTSRDSDTPNTASAKDRTLKAQQSLAFEPDLEECVPTSSQSLSISIEESSNENSSGRSSPSRVFRQHSYSATDSIPENEALDNTTKSNRPSNRLNIKESLKSRIPPFLSSRSRVKSANPVLGVMPSVSLTFPADESSPLSVNIDCTCETESAIVPSDSPAGQQLLTSDQTATCKLHYSASERHHRSNSSSPMNMTQTSPQLLVPLKNSRSTGSNELLMSKRNSLATRYSPNFYLPSSMSDHSTIFDFEDLTNLDPRKYFYFSKTDRSCLRTSVPEVHHRQILAGLT